jgi:hypothetical protein
MGIVTVMGWNTGIAASQKLQFGQFPQTLLSYSAGSPALYPISGERRDESQGIDELMP